MTRFGGLLVCILGLGIGSVGALAIGRTATHAMAPPSPSKVPTDSIQEVAIFMGASWCKAAASPQLKDSLPRIITQLRAEARSRNHSFSSIGVSLDSPAQKGVNWLNTYDRFDELIVGGGWANYGVLGLIWSDSVSSAELPQLIVLSRPILVSARMRVGPITVRERLYGVRSILRRSSQRATKTSQPISLATSARR